MPTNCLNCRVVFVVLIVLVTTCNCLKNPVITKVKRKVDIGGIVTRNGLFSKEMVNKSSDHETGRGFFGPSLLSLGKVLNFFPVGGERECQPSGYTVARAGICLNQYDCRQREGRAAGDCAHGLGVCCVFEVSCGGLVQNNLTYFMSPGFPELWTGDRDCDVMIEKTHAGITQLKIDFVHFTIGQPNRTTGQCDEDAMILGEGDSTFELCGQNHGQHIYYTLPTGNEVREDGELPITKSTRLSIRMRGSEMPRLWLLRLAQIPLAYSAPHDCLQFYTGNNGTIKTFNFASNGRHLAGQEYRACVRRNTGRCAIRYSPCDRHSFRIGQGRGSPNSAVSADIENGPGGLGGPGTGFYGPDGQFVPNMPSSTPRTNVTGDQLSEETQNGSMQQEPQQQTMPVDSIMQEEEGSGNEPSVAPVIDQPPPSPSIASRIWSFIFPSWLWGQRSSARAFNWSRWSPYAQHYEPEDDNFRYYGYGNLGLGLQGFGRQRCTDRITIPCENEYFMSSSSYITGVCDPHHCGGSFCTSGGHDCHMETSISPFAVSVHFGPPAPKRNPEENIGACLKYTQLHCDS